MCERSTVRSRDDREAILATDGDKLVTCGVDKYRQLFQVALGYKRCLENLPADGLNKGRTRNVSSLPKAMNQRVPLRAEVVDGGE
jgi:hypothetical protein